VIKVLVSSCLLGERVRYHGDDARCTSEILERWAAEGRIVAACPETTAGLPVPRPPAEIGGGDGRDVLAGRVRVGDSTGKDVTEILLKGARATLELAQANDVKLAVLKDGSPSCAVTYVHDGTFRGQRDPGLGVTAALLAQAGIALFNEKQLAEAAAYAETLEAGLGARDADDP
jgi:uncharacterized protein YbbK (DUF523 family)